MGDVRKGGAIIVFDFEGTAVKRYKLTNAWPKSLEIGSLKAGDTSYLSEKLVLTCESIEVEYMRRGSLAETLPEPAEGAAASSGQGRTEPLITEFSFVLPRGYVDGSGNVHRDGMMRLATARDELIPLRDDRVRENPAYLTVVLLARVITRIGTIADVHPGSWRTCSQPILPSCRISTAG